MPFDPITIYKVDGRVRMINPWEWPPRLQEPYVEYAVTVLSMDVLAFHATQATTRNINWYGLPDNPYRQWL